MPRRSPKAEKDKKKQIVAFKVEDEIAEFLDKLPNKSEFIRKAILAQFAMNCPLCSGTGVVDRGIHDHFKALIPQQCQRQCEKCHTMVRFPLTVDAVAPADRDRIRQFLHGGPLYCAQCYERVPPCDDCGWHIMMEQIAEHFRKVHARS